MHEPGAHANVHEKAYDLCIYMDLGCDTSLDSAMTLRSWFHCQHALLEIPTWSARCCELKRPEELDTGTTYEQ